MTEQKSVSLEQIHELKTHLDLREVAGQFVELRGTKERYGSCPRCGGVDRFHVQHDQFFCRQCLPPEPGRGRHDVFDFARFVGLAKDFHEACQVVAAWSNALPIPVRPVHSPRATLSYPSPTWQVSAQQEVERCVWRLFSSQGEDGQQYLTQRHLFPETIQAARLGLAFRRDSSGQWGPAISLPWFYDGKITAIQYRFLAPQGQRYTRFSHAKSYGTTVLYTLPARGSDTLVVLEGEFNALSVWQATEYDVVSFGSQQVTKETQAALVRVIAAHTRLVVWADQPQVACNLIAALGRPAAMILSEHDANEMLQRNQLEKVIT